MPRTSKKAIDEQKSADDTRDRLLDTAERLFALHGYSAVSTRTITDEAQVNVAAAHYYFGSKANLLKAVFKRRVDPMSAERERAMKACMEEAGGKPAAEDVIKAFVGPMLAAPRSEGERYFKLLSGRSSSDPHPDVRRVSFEVYDSVGRAFVDAMTAACPDLSKEELFWRLACIYGAMMYCRADNGRLQYLFGPEYSLSDFDSALKYAIPFLGAGMTAPPAGRRARQAKAGRKPTSAD